MTQRYFLIGASSGGVAALKQLAAALPPDFPSPILTVLHIGKHRSILPQLLGSNGPLGASHAREGEPLRPGHFHVAPPDRHMLVQDGHIVLSSGPKEHHARPAIDPLFRAAALAHGPRAVGVVLTGWGEDGTAGLQAIKQRGGVAIVQEPLDARAPSMPSSALKHAPVDFCTRIDELAHVMVDLANTPLTVGAIPMPSESLEHEQDLFLFRGDPVDHLKAIGRPAPYSCPDCGGGYTLRSLQQSQAARTDGSLWNAMSALQEQAMILRAMAADSGLEGDGPERGRLEEIAERVSSQADQLRALVDRVPAVPAAQPDCPPGSPDDGA